MKIAIAFLALATVVQADDWTQWRGLHRDGVWLEQGLLETFPADGLKVRWRVPVGPGWSSPVIAQGRVFITDAVLGPKEKPTATERIHCYDEVTGRQLWIHSYDVAYPAWVWDPGQKQGPCPTPIVHDGKLYTAGGTGRLLCFDARSGAILWKKDLAGQYKMEPFCIRGSPLIEGKLLILPKGYDAPPGVIAFDKDTGAEVWTAMEEGGYNSSPIVVSAGGKRQLIVPGRHELVSLDPATGAVYWQHKFDCGIPTPVHQGNRLLVNGMMFELDAEKPAAKVIWPARKSDADLSDTTTAILVGDLVVSHKKKDTLVCLDAKTGKPLWEVAERSVMHSLTRVGEGAFLMTASGELLRARISRQGFQVTGRAALIKPTEVYGNKPVVWSAPSYANRHVFARNDEELISASLAADP
jgi:outer membrane protein assembly factor BamB